MAYYGDFARKTMKVEEFPNETLLTLSCGCKAHMAQHFHYEVGERHRSCYECCHLAISFLHSVGINALEGTGGQIYCF